MCFVLGTVEQLPLARTLNIKMENRKNNEETKKKKNHANYDTIESISRYIA